MARDPKERFDGVKQKNEFDQFDATMRKLISVPHSEIKAALDAEKAEKEKKRKAKKPSASARASRDKH
jgi:hypothetical protein